MSEVAAPTPQAATAPAESTAAQEAAIDFSKMTGAEAKAYVEAQKSKKQQTQSPQAEARKQAEEKLGARKEVESPEQKAAEEKRQEEIRKYKVKVLGEEREVDENELKRGYSHQQAANKVYQEGQKLKKQAEEFLSMLKDPEKFYEVAQKLGHDPRGLSEGYLVKKLEEEMLDPKERELREYKAKWEAVEKEREKVLINKYKADFEQQFISALEKMPDVVADKETVGRMAGYIKRAADIGFKMTPEEAAILVKQDEERKIRPRVSSLDGDALIKFLGEDVVNKIRKYDTSRLKDPEKMLRVVDSQPSREPRERRSQASKRMTPAEWREYNRR